jgi:putative membrane protein
MACGTVAAGTVAQDHGAAHALTVDRDDIRRRLEAFGPVAPGPATA